MNSQFAPARKHPNLGVTRPHTGVDLKAELNANIIAAADGIVEKSYHHGSYGEMVIIRHNDGSATMYAHLNSRNVSQGQSVSTGAVLGGAGKTGEASGVHLHFEYVVAGQVMGSDTRVDPFPCIKKLSSTKLILSDIFYPPQFETPDDDIYEVSIRDKYAILVVPPILTTIGQPLEIDISHLPADDYYTLYYTAKSGNGNGGCMLAELIGQAAYYPGTGKTFITCVVFNHTGHTFFKTEP